MATARLLMALALAGTLLPASAIAQATKAGWWIRVDTKQTEATSIELQIGASKKDRRAWKSWRSGESPEFDLPADLAQAPLLYLHATAIPDDEDVWFCVYFQAQGVRSFDFDTQEDATMKPSDKDRRCR